MPTTARLIAAILFGLIGFAYSVAASPYFPEAQEPRYWIWMPAAVGVILGWNCGKRVGFGYPTGIANGLTTGVFLLFWAFFLMSFFDMIDLAFRKSYDGPIEAIVGIFVVMVDWGKIFLLPTMLGIYAGACLVAGFIIEFVGKRYS